MKQTINIIIIKKIIHNYIIILGWLSLAPLWNQVRFFLNIQYNEEKVKKLQQSGNTEFWTRD